ncbi:MAG: DUF503 domain-containing protein [Deltaproteobacteria bacterium]|nr:MAG: DUF503 domain-containing protein [Deltaproteobacteria bacterium]TMQ12328.1 MAG: DUF503 domain-containing protein [Deltaproteobacteria bacterium]
MARISLLLADARSLKDKRMVIRRIKDRVRERLGVFVSEVGSPEIKDSWNRGELGAAVASSDRQKALALIDEVVRVAMSAGGAEITAIAKDAITFDGEPSPVATPDPGTADRTGSADKAVAGDDWIPAAWREDP